MPAADKVKQTAQDEVNRVTNLAKEAARSQAYIYPFKVHFACVLVVELLLINRD